MTQFAYPDSLSGLHGLFAVMCALDHRARTGEGQQIDLSQLESCISVVGDEMMEILANDRDPTKRGNGSAYAAPHGCYRCRGDDRWCTVAVFSDDEWKSLCSVMGRDDLTGDSRFATVEKRLRHVDELDDQVEAWTSERDAFEVMESLQRAGVRAGVVQTAEDQYERDPHLSARGFFEEIDHAVKGVVVATGIPVGLTRTPGHTSDTGRAIGADNDYVFGELLGLSPNEIEDLVQLGAIETC
jgi:crotonobetainyl-CoA:carnitine CoA-transferase CaiB-like acyl-CoA transferase